MDIKEKLKRQQIKMKEARRKYLIVVKNDAPELEIINRKEIWKHHRYLYSLWFAGVDKLRE